MTPPLPPRGSGEGGLVGSARGARGWGAETSGPCCLPGPQGIRGRGSGRAWRAEAWRRPGGQRVGPARVLSREARTGRGYQAARPPPTPTRPPSCASWRLRVRRLFVLRRWGPGRPRHPTPGSRERPRESPRPRWAPESAAPAPQRPLQALSPRPTAPPGGGTAPLRARPGVLPLPLSLAMAPAA